MQALRLATSVGVLATFPGSAQVLVECRASSATFTSPTKDWTADISPKSRPRKRTKEPPNATLTNIVVVIY